MATSYTLLEPNLTKGIAGENIGFDTSATPSFFASTSFIYTLAFVVIIAAASFRYAYAGVLRIDASEANIKKSKEEFTRVTYGLLGVLGLWLILFTVNKDMLTGDVTLSNLKAEVGVRGSGNVTVVTTPTKPTIPTNNDDPTGWKAISDDAGVRSGLRNLRNPDSPSDGGITVNKSVCNNPTQTSCTTVGGVHPDTIAMLSQLRSTCSGKIEITGGSENGHASHGVGKTPVDLSINSPGGLNACIQAFPAGPTLNFCKKTYKQFGYIFCDERGTPHWHVFKG